MVAGTSSAVSPIISGTCLLSLVVSLGFASPGVADITGYCPSELVIEICLSRNRSSVLINIKLLDIKCDEQFGLLPLKTRSQLDFHLQQAMRFGSLPSKMINFLSCPSIALPRLVADVGCRPLRLVINHYCFHCVECSLNHVGPDRGLFFKPCDVSLEIQRYPKMEISKLVINQQV